jgi:hypothetical protein
MTTHSSGLDILVDRADLRNLVAEDAPGPDGIVLDDGEVLLRVDAFGFTANNVTYAALGDAFSYFQFFPARTGFARIPVWGFGDVVATRHPGVALGARYYGFFPMSRYLVTRPTRVTEADFMDGAPHREKLHAIYNRYVATAVDPGYRKETEDAQMLFRPLFTTSFLMDDFFSSSNFFGASSVVFSSASSKTAYGTAFLLQRRSERPELVGLTSPANASFVERLGVYDRVLAYDDVTTLDRNRPTTYVDLAGDGNLRGNVHRHFADKLVYSCVVGATHWDNRGTSEALPGASPTLFFAPDYGKKRIGEWGFSVFAARFGDAWGAFLAKTLPAANGVLRVTRGKGADALKQVYLEMLNGRARPDTGHVLSL